VRKHLEYIDRARGRFLEGTPFRYPVDAVAAGVKTLTEWCDLLLEERQADSTNLEEVIEA
jgi:hypothetical protein